MGVATDVQTRKSIDFLTANLVALRELQPAVASLVESAALLSNVERATGRDGSETFRIADETGRARWFGNTSMPGISSAELFGNVRRDQGNVLLPGIMSGREVITVAHRLAPYSAVFVIEPSPANLRMAMTLHDYTALIRAGRVVFLCGDDLAAAMQGFFEEHPGYEYPGNLFHAPQATTAQGAAARDAVERAGQEILIHHANLVESLQRRIADQFESRTRKAGVRGRPRVAVLSVEASNRSIQSVARVGSALRALQWKFQVCIPDRPGDCHIAARMDAIARTDPDFVLFLNSTPRGSREILPQLLPVVSWYLPGFPPADLPSNGAGPSDLFVASTPRQEWIIQKAGLRCLRIEPATDATAFSVHEDCTDANAHDAPIAVLADLPADRASDLNFTLPSQIALWDALRALAAKTVAGGAVGNVEQMLEEAQTQSGTPLTDDALRCNFKNLLTGVAIPSARARHYIKTLRQLGRSVELFGIGWENETDLVELNAGPIPDATGLANLFRRMQTVLLPLVSELSVQMAIDALATGAHAVIADADQPLAESFPGICDALAFVTTFRTPSELREALPAADAPRQSKAAAVILASHTVEHRLRQIASNVRDQPG